MTLLLTVTVTLLLTVSLCVPAPTDLDSNGSISAFELHDLFKEANLPLPGFRVREIIQRLDRNNDNLISFDEFVSVCCVFLLVLLLVSVPVSKGFTALMIRPLNPQLPKDLRRNSQTQRGDLAENPGEGPPPRFDRRTMGSTDTVSTKQANQGYAIIDK